MNIVVKPLIAAAALCCAVGAAAADFPFTMPLAPDTPFVQLVNATGLSFTDTFTFVAPAAAIEVSASVISIDIAPFFNVDNIQLSLRDAANTLLFTSPMMGEASKIEDFPIIGGNTYFFEVTGTVPASALSGYYTFIAVAAPIPEPETYALMLGGLGLVGWIAARRRRAD
jgi:hypothetical protein